MNITKSPKHFITIQSTYCSNKLVIITEPKTIHFNFPGQINNKKHD